MPRGRSTASGRQKKTVDDLDTGLIAKLDRLREQLRPLIGDGSDPSDVVEQVRQERTEELASRLE